MFHLLLVIFVFVSARGGGRGVCDAAHNYQIAINAGQLTGKLTKLHFMAQAKTEAVSFGQEPL